MRGHGQGKPCWARCGNAAKRFRHTCGDAVCESEFAKSLAAHRRHNSWVVHNDPEFPVIEFLSTREALGVTRTVWGSLDDAILYRNKKAAEDAAAEFGGVAVSWQAAYQETEGVASGNVS